MVCCGDWLVSCGVIALLSSAIKKGNFVMSNRSSTVPICVDLDGTLIHSDLLFESFLLLLKQQPLFVFLIPFWLLQGKAFLKAQIAQRVVLNPLALPYNQELLLWLYKQRDQGRELWLSTASNYRLATIIAEHLSIFKGVLASTDELNLSGTAKAHRQVELFGYQGFDYCGNHTIDLLVWGSSHNAVVVNGSAALSRQASKIVPVIADFPKKPFTVKVFFKAIRIHQWAKNILIFVPLLAAHRILDINAIEQAFLAFLAFGLCASSVYLLNDMLDLEADRQHPRKSQRPLAAGDLSIFSGLLLMLVLLGAGAFISFYLPFRFGLVLFFYYMLTVAYSFLLKRLVLIDTVTLAGLYTVRIVAGAVAIKVPLSFWLLLFSIFLFYSLALVKRYAELYVMQQQGKLTAVGRGYHVEDIPVLNSLGIASGHLSVLVLALYINSPEVKMFYHHPKVIWCVCVLLLYWVSRVWLKAHRGEMHDDPLIFAVTDKISLAIVMLSITAFGVAL
jgi:4-hydroxybenzoate polyprenyltransferase